MRQRSSSSKWPHISRYLIPLEIISTTQSYLKKLGSENLEGIAYWTGIFKGSEAIVRNVIFPADYANNSAGSFAFSSVDLETAFKVGNEIHKRKEYLLLQLHTHPYEAFHSFTDNNYPISHRVGFISIVIPHFARFPMEDRSTWKVYKYKGKGKWRPLGKREVTKKFIIVDGDQHERRD
jgi:hypothetical protein